MVALPERGASFLCSSSSTGPSFRCFLSTNFLISNLPHFLPSIRSPSL
jgi:hypothetical protein